MHLVQEKREISERENIYFFWAVERFLKWPEQRRPFFRGKVEERMFHTRCIEITETVFWICLFSLEGLELQKWSHSCVLSRSKFLQRCLGDASGVRLWSEFSGFCFFSSFC